MRLSDRGIAALKPRDRQFEIFDDSGDGLAIRIGAKSKTFVVIAAFPGSSNPVRRAIGRYPDVSLANARDIARKWRGLLARGIDPQVVGTEERAGDFASVVTAYCADMEARKLKRAGEVERCLRHEFVSRWGSRQIGDITRGDVIQAIDVIRARAPGMARNSLAYVKGLFGFAADRYDLVTVPTDRVRTVRLLGKKPVRQRVLTNDELQAFWRVTASTPYPWGPLFRVLLLTGLRLREAAHAQWPEIDMAHRLWVIPAARMKGGVAHAVPLTPELVAIFAALPRFGHGDFVFSFKFGRAPVTGFFESKELLRAGMKADHFTLHDLRRSFRTGLSALKIEEVVRERLMAHAQPGVKGVYDLYGYLEEKRAGLTLWSKRLKKVVA